MQRRGNIAGEYSYDAGKIIARHLIIFALAVSLLWHIFCIFAVKVFVAAPASTKNAVSDIRFIGAILPDEPIPSAETMAAVLSGKEVAHPGYSAANDTLLQKTTPMRYIPSVGLDILKDTAVVKGREEGITGAKQTPQKQFDKVSVSYRARPSEIKGPARFREVIYRPELPTYLRWEEELGVDLDRLGRSFEMELKFWVSPEGKVGMVERVSSSGHPTIDLVGIRYLKGWQFAPLPSDGTKGDQWGTIKFDFTLARKDIK